ncbi:MAG: hydrogenase iron-sulfur subunit [Deltaproteobacteria bacterium]|nr:hydrogenase iron-sulfur subunit [Deltaproteobacteria bacterium]
MKKNDKVAVLLATDEALDKVLPPQKLTAAIKERGLAVKTVAADPIKRAVAAFDRLCAGKGLAGVVAAAPGRVLERLPRLTSLQGPAALRPVLVNLAEGCTWIHADPEAAFEKAVRLIEIAAARARNRQPIELDERPVQREVLIVGSGPSAAAVAKKLLKRRIAVTALASGASPDTALPKGVKLLAQTEIKELSGIPGDLRASVSGPGGSSALRVGAVVVAEEADWFRPDLPAKITDDTRVRWLRAFDASSGDKGLSGVRSVAFLLDLSGPEPREASVAVRRQAQGAIKAGLKTTMIFRHMDVHGRTGQLEFDKLRDSGIRLVRYDRPPVIEATSEGIKITVPDMILAETPIDICVDCLVLSEEARPPSRAAALSDRLRQPLDPEGFLQPANVRHLPVGAPRRGVFFAGTGHQDLSVEDALMEADAVAGQVEALLSPKMVKTARQLVLHNRERCAMCLTCYRSCYHGAISLSADGATVVFEPGACWECGLCAAVCPQRAITRFYSPEAELAAASEIAGRPLNGKAPVVVFCCQNSPVPALESAARQGLQMPAEVVPIEVPCAGYVSQTEIMAALDAGAEKVLVIACHEDNCRSCMGSTSARGRSAQVKKDLAALGMGDQLVCFHAVAANEPHRLVHILEDAAGAPQTTTKKGEVAHG